MPDIWFIADTHFNHSNIILYEARPFKTKEEMNEVLIENWNKVVKPEDTVYHLGDVVFGGSKIADSILPKLNGYKVLIMGNHDLNRTASKWKNYFDEVYMDDVLLDGLFCLGHYPLEEKTLLKLKNNGIIVGNVHGHVHSQIYHLPQEHYKCVSVEVTNYTPIHYDEIRKHFNVTDETKGLFERR